MMTPLEYCLVNLTVHNSRVFAQFEVLHGPIFGSNFAIFCVLLARVREVLFSDAPCIKL